MEFHNVALPGKPQCAGKHSESPQQERIPAPFTQGFLVGTLMKEIAVDGPEIFRPLLFQMHQCPLPPAKDKMLDAGKLEEVLLVVRHPMCLHVTPSGREASSTETV